MALTNDLDLNLQQARVVMFGVSQVPAWRSWKKKPVKVYTYSLSRMCSVTQLMEGTAACFSNLHMNDKELITLLHL